LGPGPARHIRAESAFLPDEPSQKRDWNAVLGSSVLNQSADRLHNGFALGVSSSLGELRGSDRDH
jgi:hypothetical protein